MERLQCLTDQGLLQGLEFLFRKVLVNLSNEVVNKGRDMIGNIDWVGIGGNEQKPQRKHASDVPLVGC
jgi:hypothetical protein